MRLEETLGENEHDELRLGSTTEMRREDGRERESRTLFRGS